MDSIIKSSEEKFTRYGHKFVKGFTKDGYAVCEQCGATEQDNEIIEICSKSVIMKKINENYVKKEKLLEWLK